MVTESAILKVAFGFRNAGIGVIPIRLDGSKAPSIGSWKSYQSRLASDDELKNWFRRPSGIALICGRISRGLEVLDFDDGSLFPPWRRMTQSVASELPVVETPTGGFHVLYRSLIVSGNHKIAIDPQSQKSTLIETRGEGGYVIACGSPVEVHSAGRLYRQIAGVPLPDVPMIAPENRRVLWAEARKFDKSGSANPHVRNRQGPAPIGHKVARPLRSGWEHINVDRLGPWELLLSRAGWRTVDGVYWTRPGKSKGVSAALRTARGGDQVLVVFSTNAGVRAKTHGKFSFYSEAFHRGDYRAASMAIARGGSPWKS